MSNIYDKMLNVMQERGRAIADFEDKTGRVCLLGARNVALYGTAGDGDIEKYWDAGELSELVELLEPQAGRFFVAHGEEQFESNLVYSFNDSTKEDEEVFDMLRAASSLFEIRHTSAIKIEDIESA